MIEALKRYLRELQRSRLENEMARQRRAYNKIICRQFKVAAKLEALGEQP